MMTAKDSFTSSEDSHLFISPTPSQDDADACSSDTSSTGCELFSGSEMANSPPTITSPGAVTDSCSPGTEEMKGALNY